MTLDHILEQAPTLSPDQSYLLILGLGTQPWRCYSSQTFPDTRELIDRFIRSHGRIPGLITETMLSPLPAQVFSYYDDTSRASYKGGLYSNGAVVYVLHPTKGATWTLFIDDHTAREWGYPREGYTYLASKDSEN